MLCSSAAKVDCPISPMHPGRLHAHFSKRHYICYPGLDALRQVVCMLYSSAQCVRCHLGGNMRSAKTKKNFCVSKLAAVPPRLGGRAGGSASGCWLRANAGCHFLRSGLAAIVHLRSRRRLSWLGLQRPGRRQHLFTQQPWTALGRTVYPRSRPCSKPAIRTRAPVPVCPQQQPNSWKLSSGSPPSLRPSQSPPPIA